MAQTVKIINLTIYIYFAVEYKDISTELTLKWTNG
jgi:hypothetical protein